MSLLLWDILDFLTRFFGIDAEVSASSVPALLLLWVVFNLFERLFGADDAPPASASDVTVADSDSVVVKDNADLDLASVEVVATGGRGSDFTDSLTDSGKGIRYSAVSLTMGLTTRNTFILDKIPTASEIPTFAARPR